MHTRSLLVVVFRRFSQGRLAVLAVVILVNLIILAVAALIARFLPADELEGGGWSLNYTTRDLILIAVMSAVGGVADTGLSFPWQAAQAAGGPLASAALAGVFAWNYVIVYALVRKPGAALATGILSTIVQALLGNAAGLYTLGWGVLLGLAYEVVFGAAGYRKLSLALCMVAAGAACQFQTIWSWVLYGWAGAVEQYWLSIPITIISGAILSGAVGYGIAVLVGRSGLVRSARGLRTA
jgi:energy-coupling factor transport system substrate-specific component